MGNRWKLLVVLLACGALLLGCDKDKPDKPTKVKKTGTAAKPAPKPAPAPTALGPKAVALAMWKAMVAGDGEGVAACTDCSDEDKDLIKKTMPGMAKVAAFSVAGLKKFGKEAWVAAAKKAEMAHFAEPPKEFDPRTLKTLTCKIEGDKATCNAEGIKKPLELIKKGDVWLIVPDDMPKKEGRPQMIAMVSAMAKAAEAAMGEIGKEGATAEKVFEVFAKTAKGG
jgi:hypothetical protein